ncbi:glycosyltransferase family 4 protein [Thermogladius sp. KZ2Tp1]|uniref:glycosyltransferase family 4 protein n=1 Tax=Thermogladius sp. KZ2Tp1 TaxID=3136289 RepID=UPI003DA938FC
MKILHIVQPLIPGGVSNVVTGLVKAFNKIGVENIVVTFERSSPEILKTLEESNVEILNVNLMLPPFSSYFYALAVSEKIKKIVTREKPDAIMIHPGWLSIISRFLKTELPIIVTVHGTYFNELKYMKYHPIAGLEKIRYMMGIRLSFDIEISQLRTVAQLNNTLISAVSKNTKRELVNAGVPSHRVFSILNGVDKDLFKPMNKDYAKTVVEEVFRVKLKDKVLLHVNPGPIKGTHMLIKALAMVKRVYGENITLLVAGRIGPKSYKEYVEVMVKSLGLENNVGFLGYVQQDKLPLLYNAADLTVVPSYSEGGPLITPESLACGTPVVATNVGGNPEYLALANLNNLLANIESYDFSRSLALKLIEGVKRDYHVNSVAVPSWHSTAKLYLKVAASLLSRQTDDLHEICKIFTI